MNNDNIAKQVEALPSWCPWCKAHECKHNSITKAHIRAIESHLAQQVAEDVMRFCGIKSKNG